MHTRNPRRNQASKRIDLVMPTLFLMASLALSVPGWADPGRDPDPESGSGRMQVLSGQGKEPVDLPLKHTGVDARITGIVGTVAVTQEFCNPYETPIEAVYVFPLPQHAAVYSMKMKIGDRVIQADIKRREEARALYEQARDQGKTASLLDQERPNIFTQSVANILPGDDIRVEITYFEDLRFEEGRYEFVFPMVVGPRYMPGETVGRSGTGWSGDTNRVPDASRISPPLLPPGVRSGHDISVRVDLDAGMPFRDLETPSHAIRVEGRESSRAAITLAPGDTIPNKDFILRWKVDQKRPVAGFLAHKDERGGTFLLALQPEIRLPRSRTAPREYVFVIDTSGSMHGFPLEQSKRVVQRCLDDLGPEDRFQVILFAGSASTLAPVPLEASSGNIRKAVRYIQAADGSGGTEFLPALEKALDAPKDPERSRIVLFLSDGYIGYETQVLKYMNEHRGDSNLFPLGVGTGTNRFLIDAMARIGQGEPFYLTPDEAPDPVVERFFRYVSRPSLTNIEVRFQGVDVEDLRPEKLPDLFEGRPLSMVGRYRKGGTGKAILTGWLAGKPWKQTLTVELPDQEAAGSGLPLLWARRSIEAISDQQALGEVAEDKARERITALALEYSLMSAYTSFVAVDSQIRNPDGTPGTVAVPIPLPDQVSPLAAPGQAYQASGGSVFGLFKSSAPSPAVREERPVSAPFPAEGSRDALEQAADGRRKPDKPDHEQVPGRNILEVRIRGTLDRSQVLEVLEKALKDWTQGGCLNGFSGTLDLSLEILSDGSVKRAEVRGESGAKGNTATCLRKALEKLVFPGSEAVSHVQVVLSFP
jgi:Ca-activated chloride channel homolog